MNGRLGATGPGGVMKAYAPEGWARVYNEFTSNGLKDTDWGSIYNGLQAVKNGLVAFKLPLPGYHGVMSAMKASGTMLAKGIAEMFTGKQEIMAGQFAAGGRQLARGVGSIALATPGVAAAKLTARGQQVQRVWKDLEPHISCR